MEKMKTTYKDAGVDVERGYQVVKQIKGHVHATMLPGVLTGIGSFGSAFSIGAYKEMKEPVLVSGTDGVGTKLKLACEMNQHDTIGIDCVAMCVNDILCSGAQPLFFLDYIATAHIQPDQIEKIVEGIAKGCIEGGCALVGGETAEMPGFYKPGEYDLAGFSVGIVDRETMIDGKTIEEGDVIVGLASTGIHSNGYTLVRRLIKDLAIDLTAYDPLLGETFGEALLKPTKIYTKAIQAAKQVSAIKGIVHITGGGFIENIPRVLPENRAAYVTLNAIKKPPIYHFIEKWSGLETNELYNTFNMGIGMMLIVSPIHAQAMVSELNRLGEEACIIGKIQKGKQEVVLCQD